MVIFEQILHGKTSHVDERWGEGHFQEKDHGIQGPFGRSVG